MFPQEFFLFDFFGFPAPDRVPTELEETLLHWKTDDAKEQQGLLLQSFNVTVPNNPKQQLAFDTIMESIDYMVEAGRDEMTSHVCHIITGPGGTGKLALFRKLHAACQAKGLSISICTATSLAAQFFDGATTDHSLLNYPVEEEDDVNNQDCPQCEFNKQRSDFLKEVSVIFWDEFISNDQMLMEAVVQEFKTKWGIPCYYVFICTGDFAQVSVLSIMCAVNVEVLLLLLIFFNRFFPSFAVTTSSQYSLLLFHLTMKYPRPQYPQLTLFQGGGASIVGKKICQGMWTLLHNQLTRLLKRVLLRMQ
jgi:hypothetical protein